MKPSYTVSLMALFMGVLLSCVAGYFSVIGLATIFSGAYNAVLVMAGTLEASKVVAASWIYRNWSIAPRVMRVYMISAVTILVLITSMGIFGYLSKAHIDQTLNSGDNGLRLEQIQMKIDRQQKRIDDAEKVIDQLDKSVQTLIDYERVRGKDGAIAVRESQKEERESLNAIIDESSDVIATLNEEKLLLQKEKLQNESEIGPLKYVAELLYKDATDQYDDAVRYITVIIVMVFDPLAVCMILAGNTGIARQQEKQEKRKKRSRYVQVEKKKVMKVDPTSIEGHNIQE